MNLFKNYIYVWKNTFDFDGRAGREEFWLFFLVNIIMLPICYLLGEWTLIRIYEIVVFLPGLSVAIRRLHDTNRSGWWYLLTFIPLGAFVLLYFYTRSSDSRRNNYGVLMNDGYYY